MFPRLLQIGSFSLPTYGFLVAMGVLIGMYICARLARTQGILEDDAWNLGILMVLSGIVGAKILLIANEWPHYSQNPREIFSMAMLQSGGVFSGGLLGALLAGYLYMRVHKMPLWKTLDSFAPGLAFGHVLGRLGCFSAGCCYGKPTDWPWGVTFTSSVAASQTGVSLGVHLHPTQLIEGAAELVNFFILLWLFRRKSFDGQVFGTFMVLYGIERFFIEFLRGDEGRGLLFGGILTTTQAISIGLVIVGGMLWLRKPNAAAPAVQQS